VPRSLLALSIVAALVLSALPTQAAAASGWGLAVPLETQDGSVDSPQVAVDNSGNAIAVWNQFDGAHQSVWANRYVALTGWDTPTLLELDDTSHAVYPQVAMDAAGDAVVVWLRDTGATVELWSNRYVAGSGWGAATQVDTNATGGPENCQIAIDDSGNALAVWDQGDGARYNIWANWYAPGTGWGTAMLIETDDAGSDIAPQVAVDGDGNAVAVWRQSDGTRTNIWANRYPAGTRWGTAELIETDDAGDATYPTVGVDGSGNAVAVWEQSNGSRTNVWANQYVMRAGWGRPQLIETNDSGDAHQARVAVDAKGDAVVSWYQYDGITNNIWANRYTAGGRWGDAEIIETNNVGYASDPRVGVDAAGNAVAVWSDFDGTRQNLWANQAAAGSGWGAAALLETRSEGWVMSSQLAMAASGTAVAVWMQYDGTRWDLWANHFKVPDVTAPAIALTLPASGASSDLPTIWVAGMTEPGASVSVNGYAAAVGANGSFGLRIALQPGPNPIVATAWDAAGNPATFATDVTFNDPLPSVQAELTAAQADLALAQSQVDALAADANATDGALAAARANQTAAEARLSALESSLASTQAALLETQAQLTAARSDINGTKTQGVPAATDTSLAVMLGIAGIAVGGLGVAMAARAGRAPRGKPTAPQAPPPPEAPK
jgi:hypothetical protein